MANIVPFIKLFYGVHYFLNYQQGQHVEGVTIIESFSNMRQGDPLEGLLFILAHYRVLLETIACASNCIFLSLTDDTHIVGPMNEISCAFNQLSTQLALFGLRVKVSKCMLWNPLRIFLGVKIPEDYTLVTNGLCILGVLMGFQDFATHFLDEVLFQDVAHINDPPLLGNTHVPLGILSSCVARRPSFLTQMAFHSSSFLFLLAGFDMIVM